MGKKRKQQKDPKIIKSKEKEIINNKTGNYLKVQCLEIGEGAASATTLSNINQKVPK